MECWKRVSHPSRKEKNNRTRSNVDGKADLPPLATMSVPSRIRIKRITHFPARVYELSEPEQIDLPQSVTGDVYFFINHSNTGIRLHCQFSMKLPVRVTTHAGLATPRLPQSLATTNIDHKTKHHPLPLFRQWSPSCAIPSPQLSSSLPRLARPTVFPWTLRPPCAGPGAL